MNGQLGLGATELPGKQCAITGSHDAHDVPPFGIAEYRCPGLHIERPAHARRADPQTSHEAARALKPLTLTASRKAVLWALGKVGPMADEEWMAEYGRFLPARGMPGRPDDLPRQSPSGLRSRRADLVEMGLVEAVGETKIRNRRCQTWGLTAAGQLEWAAL